MNTGSFTTDTLYGPERISHHSRREFLKRMGGGIFVFFTIRGSISAEDVGKKKKGRPDFNAYLRIGPDGKVTGYTGKIEMGQGINTSLRQMLAEELDVSMDVVNIVLGDTSLCPWDAGTWGSMTTRFYGPALRKAAAEARAVLLQLAAERLELDVGRLAIENGAISDKAGGKMITFVELTEGKLIERYLEVEPEPKDFSEFKVSGKSHNRVDGYEKVTGKAIFTGDIRIKGMVYAKILRPPAHGSTLGSVDTTAAEKMDGVEVVRDGDLIAVLHALPDKAENALKQITADWDIPDTKIDYKTIFDHLTKDPPEGNVIGQSGEPEAGKAASRSLLEGTYKDGYVAHAPIETHAALAQFEGDQLTVWASTQAPFMHRRQISQNLNIPEEKVRIITPFVGGGFGGKASGNQIFEAVRLARLAKKPVQVAWSREEEFFFDTFRPAAVVKIASGIDENGNITHWNFDTYGGGSRGAEVYYAIDHHRTKVIGGWGSEGGDKQVSRHPLAVGAWRGPDNNTNTWARESMIDMLANSAGMDALDFRLKNLKDKRMIRTLKAAADRFGWTPARSPSGRGYGIATGTDVGACVALMSEVEVDSQSGEVTVVRVVCALDMGQVINPEGAIIQAEGCVAMGLGYALTEEVRFEGGRVLDKGFTRYKLPRFSDVPHTEIVLVEANELAPQGGGEPAIICMGGVIANAIYDVTGARLDTLPMTPARIKEALANV